MAILRRSKRATVRAMCDVTLMEKKNNQELIDTCNLKRRSIPTICIKCAGKDIS